MLAAIPLLLSLTVANVVPVIKRDESSLIQRDASPFEVYKREDFSIGGELTDEISDAINAIVHIPGIDNGALLSDIVSVINETLSSLKVTIEELDSSQIVQLIEKAVAEVSAKLGSVLDGGIGIQLVASIKDVIGAFLGISIL